MKDNLTRDSITKLKINLELMQRELTETNKQIKLLENNISPEWDKIGYSNGISIEELENKEKSISNEIDVIKKEIKKSKLRPLLIAELTLLPVVLSLFIFTGVSLGSDILGSESNTIQSKYLIENLKGDTVDTWKSWRLIETTMNVNIIATGDISEEQTQAVIDAITSMDKIEIDDSLTHKGPKGSSSTYYFGWNGALNGIIDSLDETKYKVPVEFNIIKSEDLEGDVVIKLSTLKDSDGFTGYTKSIVDGNEILKSYITIYDAQNLTPEKLATITRHEFGHALGLGHSTAREDLMAPTIDMTYPYISECNVDAIKDLYNGNDSGTTICKK